MSDDHATDRPRAADAEPGATAHPVDWAFAARTARSLAAAGPRFT
ncbi:hydrolase, partial [Micrococcus luteus]|nr:hydrolase [Micrococcus luteus]